MKSLNNNNRKKIIESLRDNKRLDGRTAKDFREITIETGISKNAEGSARVKIGDCEVIAGVKIEASEPYTDHEDEGTLITTVEFLPLSSPNFEAGPPKINSIETARIIDRAVRESGFIDFKKLCIKKGEKVYTLLIDIFTINDDGNLIDVGCLAALAALMNAKMPEYDEKTGRIKYGKFTKNPLPLSERIPITITSFKVGDKILVDPTREEEETADGRISFGVTSSKKGDDIMINSSQKGEGSTFTQEEIEEIIDLAVEKFKELKNALEKNLK